VDKAKGVVTTPGGFNVSVADGRVRIQNPDGKWTDLKAEPPERTVTSTRTSKETRQQATVERQLPNDPVVRESDGDVWRYAGAGTFLLPDGTQIRIQEQGTTSDLHINRVDIYNGNKHVGIDSKLTAISLCIMLPFIPLLHHLAQKEEKLHEDSQRALGELNDQCAQAVGTVKLQRLTQSAAHWHQKLYTKADSYRQKRLRTDLVTLALLLASGLVPILSYGVMFTLGIPKVIQGTLSVGEFLALQGYIFILQGPLNELGFLIGEWQQDYTSLKRISQTLHEKESPRLREFNSILNRKWK
jgi:ABC-type multidrug transport system fused ATPase/permease subunit